jgi:RND family efflux transporter MFP subunit
MKKLNILIAVILAIGISACSEKTEEKLKEELTNKRKELTTVQLEISKLEKQISDAGIELNSDNRVLVSTSKLETTDFKHYIEVSGNLTTNLDALVSPEINGQIKEIFVEEGEHVKKGDILVQLKTDVTRKSIKELETSLELAKTLYKKQKSLWDKEIGSEVQYLQAKNNVESLESKLATLNEQLDMATIRAPYSGYIEDIYQKEGEIASPGRQILLLVNIQQLKVEADISEHYLPSLAIGEDVILKFPTYPDVEREVKISNIGKYINPNNRTVKVSMNVDNTGGKLMPNMMSNIIINDYRNDSALVIPSIIVNNDVSGGSFIYVAEEKDGKMIAVKKYIKLGKSYKGQIEVLEGLKAGDLIIDKGYNVVNNGLEIKENHSN